MLTTSDAYACMLVKHEYIVSCTVANAHTVYANEKMTVN